MLTRLRWALAEHQGNEDYRRERAAAPPPPPVRPSAPGMTDLQAVEYAQRVNRLNRAGRMAPGVIHAVRPAGERTLSGGQRTELDVSFRPPGGDLVQTTIAQVLLPAQLEELGEGQRITVAYDPEAPGVAVVRSW